MAITSAGGLVVTSSAWCGVVTASTATSVTINGRFRLGANQNNGNVETVAACGPTTMASRNVLINRGACEQERYVTSIVECATCDTTTLTVHEAWCTNPTACQNVDIAYTVQDAATVNGLQVINKRVQDYTSTRFFTVGNGTSFAYFALLDGASLETVDRSSTTLADVTIANNATLSNGVVANGKGAAGGYYIGTPVLANEIVFTANNGARLNFNDPVFFPNVNAPEFRILGACTTGTVRLKNVFATRQMEITAPLVTYTCLNIVGKNNASDRIDFSSNVSGQTYNLTNVEVDNVGLRSSITTGTVTRTINITNFNVKRKLTAANLFVETNGGTALTTTLNITNPRWSVTATDFTLTNACSVITERFRQNVTVQKGVCKVACSILNHISTRSSTAAIRVTTTSNACGIAVADAESNRWTGTAETLAASTLHGLQVHNYAETSFATVPSLTNASLTIDGQNISVAVQTDPYVVEGTEATALADGTTKVTICEGTNPHSIIKYTGGSGTLAVGAVLTGTTSTADGVVKEIIEGNSTAGTVVLTTRDANPFTAAGEAATTPACAWSGCVTACSQQCFTWLMCVGQILCSPRTIQQGYDSMKAKLHECAIDTADNCDDVKRWGVGEHPHPLQGVDSNASPKTFQTVRNVANTAGWVVTGLAGYGSITGFTDDNGGVFTFASTVPISITVVEAEDFVTPVACARVNIQNSVSPFNIILNTTTNACGIASICLPTPACPITVLVRTRKEVEEYVKQPGTISVTSGLSLTIGVKDDPKYTPT